MAEPQEKPATDDAFWRFSLAFYALPGVAEAVLALQDQGGYDVNLILFAVWLGLAGYGRLDRDRLAAAERAIHSLRTEVVAPLRALRRRLKPSREGDIQRLREEIAGLELAAERAVQQRLEARAGPPARPADAGDRCADAQANLVLYLGADAADRAEAAVIREALATFSRPD
jgi:uncharacterized protein (TIGR02444 family)